MTKTVLRIDQTRTVHHPVRRRTTRFERGTFTTIKKLETAGLTTIPAWVTVVDELEARIADNNHIVISSPPVQNYDWTEKELLTIAKVIEALVKVGIRPANYTIGKGATEAFGNEGKDAVWVGVVADGPDGRFVRDNGKPVSLKKMNFIGSDTFLRRVRNDQPLFVGG